MSALFSAPAKSPLVVLEQWDVAAMSAMAPVSQIVFDLPDPAEYFCARLIVEGLKPTVDGRFAIQFSGDGGASFENGSSAYGYVSKGRDTSGVDRGNSNNGATRIEFPARVVNAMGATGLAGEIVFTGWGDPVLKSTVTWHLFGWSVAPDGLTDSGTGFRDAAAAHNAARFWCPGADLGTRGRVTLVGYRKP